MQRYCSRLNFSLKDEPIEQRPKEPSVDDGQEDLTRDGGVEFIPSLNPATLQLAQEDEVNIQVSLVDQLPWSNAFSPFDRLKLTQI